MAPRFRRKPRRNSVFEWWPFKSERPGALGLFYPIGLIRKTASLAIYRNSEIAKHFSLQCFRNVIDSISESGISQISLRNLRKLDCAAKPLTLLLIPL
jgi:hypothetical protein